MFAKGWLPSAFVLAVALLLLVSLSLATESPGVSGQVPDGTPVPNGPATVEVDSTRLSCAPVTIDPQSFSDSTSIDNRYAPLLPGTRFILEGTANAGVGPVSRQVVTTVTDLTKVINGVRTVVVFEQDFTGGLLEESELAFVAQDSLGNVWTLGEHPELFEGFTSLGAAHTWVSGVDGAEAGILMPADPSVDMPAYAQGFAPGIGFLDCGKVVQTGLTVCVRIVTCYTDVVVIDEASPLDPGSAVQRKSFAPNVGVIQIEAVADPEAETLDLVAMMTVSAQTMAEVRAEALLLEENAYRLSAAYRQTGPIGQ